MEALGASDLCRDLIMASSDVAPSDGHDLSLFWQSASTAWTHRDAVIALVMEDAVVKTLVPDQ